LIRGCHLCNVHYRIGRALRAVEHTRVAAAAAAVVSAAKYRSRLVRCDGRVRLSVGCRRDVPNRSTRPGRVVVVVVVEIRIGEKISSVMIETFGDRQIELYRISGRSRRVR